ncbi:MAG: 3-methylornithine--L-lysine ligase PylC [Firmicutes bacterium]|nr:3-methylornithine--L-lysine ligase PylC [Bacillota bacterium]
MRVAIIGGRLQGLEAVYLAKKAEWQTLLIDKEPEVPAAGLCDRFLCLDLLNAADQKQLQTALDRDIDLIIPALENRKVLENLTTISALTGVPLAFDPAAYDLSSSKRKSDHFFAELNLPQPLPWPQGTFPYLAKPSAASGSEGVKLLESEAELKRFQTETTASPDQWVIQEFIEGPSYSIEVIGDGKRFIPLQVTDLYMDEQYDCRRVVAPSILTTDQQQDFAALAATLASSIGLLGVMDVEVILHNQRLKLLEIDARLPSQTPTAVYHSSGVNLLELIAAVFTGGLLQAPSPAPPAHNQAALFEHLVVTPDGLQTAGEHVIASAGPLTHLCGFFGADEALTNYQPGLKSWVATLIITAHNREAVFAKREEIVARIARELNLKRGCKE